jgi:uncharacterized membrane protein
MTLPKVYPFTSPRPRPAPADDAPHIPTYADQNISAIIRLEQEALSHRSYGQRMADGITGVATKPWFVVGHALFFVAWMAVNTLGSMRFDPRPFSLLNSVIALEAIFLTLLVLATQNRMARLSDRRGHLNLQVDLLTEQEMTVVLRMLEQLFAHFKLDPIACSPQSAELRKMTDVEALADKLDTGLQESANEKNADKT